MKKILAVALLSVVATTSSFAADFYAGVKLGSTKHHIDVSGYEETAGAVAIFGGYSFNPNVAVEIEATSLGSLLSNTVKIGAASISVVGSHHFDDQTSVFAKLGVASTHEQITGASADRSGLTFGLGGQYNITKTVGLRLSWDRYAYGGTNGFYDASANMYSVGALIKF